METWDVAQAFRIRARSRGWWMRRRVMESGRLLAFGMSQSLDVVHWRWVSLVQSAGLKQGRSRVLFEISQSVVHAGGGRGE